MNKDMLAEIEAFDKSNRERRERLGQLRALASKSGAKNRVINCGFGMQLKAKQMIGNPTGKGGGTRKSISTFTMASRRAMRKWLLTHRPAEGLSRLSVTLTVPGVRTKEDCLAAWLKWRTLAKDKNWGVVWRCEKHSSEEREATLHWHLYVVMKSAAEDPATQFVMAEKLIRRSWADVCDSVWPDVESGKHTFEDKRVLIVYGGKRGPISEQVGAMFCNRRYCKCHGKGHMVICENVSTDETGSWFRYLCDHSTKLKKGQVAENIGKHWGVISRKLFVENNGNEVEVTEKQYHVLRRAYERLCTYHKKSDCDFGTKLGHRPSRGRNGTTYAFVRPETVLKLLRYAKGQITSPSEQSETIEPLRAPTVSAEREATTRIVREPQLHGGG